MIMAKAILLGIVLAAFGFTAFQMMTSPDVDRGEVVFGGTVLLGTALGLFLLFALV
jgi:hypothetical protein